MCINERAREQPQKIRREFLESDRSRYAPQSDEIVGFLKQLGYEMIIDLSALEEEGLDRITEEISVLTQEEWAHQDNMAVEVEKMKGGLRGQRWT